MEYVFTPIVIILLVGFVIYILRKPLVDGLLNIFERRAKDIFKDERENLLEQYKNQQALGNKDLEAKKDLIKQMIEKIDQDLRASKDKIAETEKERINQYSNLKTVLDDYKIITEGLRTSTDRLRNLLADNQKRGKYGEEVAETLMQSVGFVKGQTYLANEAQETSTTRPDFTILLPGSDSMRVNVDVKFPYQSLIKYQEAESEDDKKKHLKSFATDVKDKVKQVTTRDYISSSENTLDFVILFIPNEMIFSFIYDQLPDVWNEAFKKKVIMAGPFSFTAILRMIYQSHKSFVYQKNISQTVQLITEFHEEFTKFNNELDKLGTRLESAQTQFRAVAETRSRKLKNVVDKIESQSAIALPEEGKLISPNLDQDSD